MRGLVARAAAVPASGSGKVVIVNCGVVGGPGGAGTGLPLLAWERSTPASLVRGGMSSGSGSGTILCLCISQNLALLTHEAISFFSSSVVQVVAQSPLGSPSLVEAWVSTTALGVSPSLG